MPMKIKAAFNEQDEHAFTHNEQVLNRPYIRAMFVLFMILYGLFGLTDRTYYPDTWQLLYVIRFGVVIPLIAFMILFSYTKTFIKHHQYFIAVSFFVGGIGIATMLIIDAHNIVYYGGLFMVYFAGYLLVRLRFLYATVAGWSILLFHLLGYSIINTTFSDTFLFGSLFYVGANLIGMVGAYQFEAMNRRRFMHEKRISQINDDLKQQYEEKADQYNRLEQSMKANKELMAINKELDRLTTSLTESEKRFKILHNASFGGIVVHDKGRIIECNQGLADITGYAMDELIGMNGMLLIAEAQRDFVMNHIQSGYDKPYETWGIRKNGERYPLKLEARTIPYEGKQVRVVEFRDVTELKQAQDALVNTLEEHKMVLNSTVSGIYAIDNDDRCTYVNENTLRLLGYDDENELRGKKMHDVVHHSYEDGSPYPAEECALLRGMKSETIINHEDIIWCKDGTFFPVSYSSSPQIKAGEVVGQVVVFYDISERKRLEKERALNEMKLRESEENYRLLTTQMQLGLALHEIICDDDGTPIDYRFISVNKGFEDLTGLRADAVVGRTVKDVLPATEPHWIERYGDVALSGKPVSFESYAQSQDKHFSVSAYSTKKGYFAVVFDDVTMTKKIQEEQREREKQLQHSKTLLNYIIEHNNAGVAVHDKALNYVYVSKKYLEQYGLEEDIIGKHHYDVFPDLPQKWRDVHQRSLQGEVISEDRDRFMRHDGTLLWTRWESRPWHDVDGYVAGIVVYTEVINKQVEAEKQKEHLIMHDHLTGLTNRLYFDQRIKAMDTQANLPLAVINFDVDGLRIINEAYGHAYGDKLIVHVAEVLRDVFDDDAVVSRVGGDEFSVILPKTLRATAQTLAKTVVSQVKAHRIKDIQTSISYGIAIKKSREPIDKLFVTAENEMYSNKIYESSSYRSNSIKAILHAYHEKNPREETHSNRVASLCEKMGTALNMDDNDIKMLRAISHLHDIGKISIDEAILNKPGKLNNEEWKKIKKHPEIGARIIAASDEYAPIAEDILAHHERYDGKGYPRGLAKNNIPLRARIISIVDCYDAMTSERPYRQAMTHDEAIDEIIRCANTQFDPTLVDVFVQLDHGDR